MRRCLRSLLVGVLVVSLSVDAARACGHLRRWRRAGACCAAPVVVPRAHACDPCGVVVLAGRCGCDGAVGVASGCEPIACCGPVAAVAVETPASEPVVAAPVEQPVVAPEPPPATPQPSPVAAAVPELEPVEPVSATEPAATADLGLAGSGDVVAEEPVVAAPATIADEPVAPSAVAVEPAPAVTPPPRNIFEEADEAVTGEPQAAIEPTTTPDQPVQEEVPVDALPFEPAAEEPAVVPPPADAPALDIPADDTPTDDTPADDLPVIEPDVPVEPAPEPAAAVEPLRRWIDDTAAYAVVGRLVDVRGDVVEIVKADGRSVNVPLGRLSGFDRGYVAAAAPRIAAARRSVPLATDTASR